MDSENRDDEKWNALALRHYDLDRFDRALDVATDSVGNIYVIESPQIIKFDEHGHRISNISLNHAIQNHTIYPKSIAIDSKQNILIVDDTNSRVLKFDYNGTFLLEFNLTINSINQRVYPENLAIDSTDNLFVTDKENSRIVKFNHNGSFIDEWNESNTRSFYEFFRDGWYTSGIIGLFLPKDIVLDNQSKMYVIDFDQILVFDEKRTFITGIGPSFISNELSSPTSIAIDKFGNIFVGDTGLNRVLKFDNNSNFVTQWGGPENLTGSHFEPNNISVDPAGNVIVINDYRYLQKFSNTGEFMSQWGINGTKTLR